MESSNCKLYADIESERTAWGFGGQIGLNYAANDTWNFAMRYDTKIKMEFEADHETVKSIFRKYYAIKTFIRKS